MKNRAFGLNKLQFFCINAFRILDLVFILFFFFLIQSSYRNYNLWTFVPMVEQEKRESLFTCSAFRLIRFEFEFVRVACVSEYLGFAKSHSLCFITKINFHVTALHDTRLSCDQFSIDKSKCWIIIIIIIICQ